MLNLRTMNEVDRFLSEARKMNADARNELADRILELVPDEIDPAIDDAWREELRRRRAKIASGETELLAWEDVRDELFAK